MATVQGKRKLSITSVRVAQSLPVPLANDDQDLFVDAPPDVDSGSEESDGTDTTDSEESQYSGLEEEDSTDDEDGDNSEGKSDEADSESETDSEDQNLKAAEQDVGNNNTLTNKSHAKTLGGSRTKKVTSDSKVTVKPSTSSSKDVVGNLQPDEYAFDSSDEEDIRNTVGNVPMQWYKEYEHIGYDWDAQKIIKPKHGDELDEFLNKMDNPNYWRTVKDKMTGQKVVLSDKDVELIQRMKRGKYVDPNYNPYEPYVDFFTHEKMIHPVTNHPQHKRSFIPSKWERLKVGKMVHAIKMGWMKPRVEKTDEDEEEQFYMLWDKEENEMDKRLRQHIPAPRMALPIHAESYNPPPEYLFTEEEELAWKDQDPEDRRMNFVPQKYSCLRHVPSYSRFINERFERCLDLYLCPRQRKMRMNVNPEDLIPKLPKPKELQPFPTTQAIVYKGHEDLVRSISVDPSGEWLVSGSDDKTIKFWEVSTGRCMKTLMMDGVIKCVAWNPNSSVSLVLAVVDVNVFVINPKLGDKLVAANTDTMIGAIPGSDGDDASKVKVPVKWQQCEGKLYDEGFRLQIFHPKPVTHVTWHGRGDYFTVTMPQGESRSVLIHQLSKQRSQNPFRKSKGLVQCVLFHPTRPFLFVATQRYVRVYNLLKQELSKKLMTNCKWVSSMAVHPGGDNIIIGSYDCRLSWFDLDLSTKPYQTLRHHKKAIRQVCYHKRYPLFASASDDGTVIICHGMVYNDLLQNPLLVPVKILRGHTQTKDLGVLDCEFHPTQPWIFSSGSDCTIRLFT